MRERLGHFRLVRRLGEGGMGVVFEAFDERLDRTLAIKTIRRADDATSKERFWREARAAARVNHPNVCQIYDVGETDGELFIAMELLSGESLAARLTGGPLTLEDTGPLALGILGALEALHRQQIVHRDLKPSNVHLTAHGVKLLDFGLARPVSDGARVEPASVTRTGIIVGTPRYMAPEQWKGEAIDARTDLFALGALLYETMTGSAAFPGTTIEEVRHAALFEQPPALAGPAAVAAVDRVLRRAMAKRREDRFEDAPAMAGALREALLDAAGAKVDRVHAVTRLIVLPFRILRPDPDVDFLGLTLADAVASSLAGFESLVVRSSWSAGSLPGGEGGGTPDLRRIAEEAGVDLVVFGTILRAGERLRVTAQLLEVPAGTTVWSQTLDATWGDIFALQDKLAREIVASLSLPLAGREKGTLQRDVPATARAYELYLRANELSTSAKSWPLARDLYLECLKEDPRYAPAWARLGRVYRLLAKYHTADAEEHLLRAVDAFRRSLEVNPDLSIAHNLQANLEVEMGRGVEVFTRLLGRMRTQRSDPELMVALVHAFRYAGLLHASIAADQEARRLDPRVPSSVQYTYWMLGEHERALEGRSDFESFLRGYSLGTMGRIDEAVALYRELEAATPEGSARDIIASQRLALVGERDACLSIIRKMAVSSFRDPEGIYLIARTACYVGDSGLALEILHRAVSSGFYADRTLAKDPWLDSIRDTPEFLEIYRAAEAGRRRAVAAFFEAEGDKLLGITSP